MNCEFNFLIIFVINILNLVNADVDPALKKFLQNKDLSGGALDAIDTKSAEQNYICARPCEGATPMLCYYHFTLENYNTVNLACGDCLKGNLRECKRKGCITAAGVERSILSINRQFPGPSIQVCKKDTIVIDIHNQMIDRQTSFHFHGMYMKHTPFMDGVPMVTQCPIDSGQTFRYKFPALPSGTLFYHSHMALQKMDGLEGALIIRTPRSQDINSATYDYDLYSHVIVLSDFLNQMTDTKFPGNTYNFTSIKADAILINGRYQNVKDSTSKNIVPMSTFKVNSNKKYRFRIIGGSCLACPVVFTVHKHQLTVIAADGTSLEPEIFDSLTVSPGDRIDVVINANNTPGQYWIQARTICDDTLTCEAVLIYDNDIKLPFSSKRPVGQALPRGKCLNAVDLNPQCKEDPNNVCWSHMNALKPPVNPEVLKAAPDDTIVLAVDEYFFDVKSLFWQDNNNTFNRFMQSQQIILTHLLNNKSFITPSFPLLTQSDQIPPEITCPKNDSMCTDRAGQGTGSFCECVNIIPVKLGQVVQLIFIDWGDSSFLHPMHLHGTDMFIIEQGQISGPDKKGFLDTLKSRLAAEGETLNSTRAKPCVKDTITIPSKGYAVVRVHFNNPGMWLCHCHFNLHSETGMAVVFQVGTRDQFVAPPPGFPTCNDYSPKAEKNEYTEIDWDDEPVD